ncbi:cytochrome c-type biogenesis protein CcmH [Aestuariivirga litoralis]|uniref:Cytochrome c-type biogenesis protein n=1 Tax=Aestuariivirga litoralis TaxID=2650924 RepID=A0A2W2BNA8_9HYPH|nr:cytochrome c-type biogenesis protein [Aestuariivirga litoralis]PZF77739.1 cytochrome c-type biogenesis protein CcmH [Aestuariivirga litoralis]
MRKLLAILALLVAVQPALALTPDEQLKDPALEQRARAVSAQLRCLVCQNQSIDDSEAPLAKDLRTLVREQITAGKTNEQVLDYIVERYGQFVLLKPRFERETLILWGTPFAVLLIAGGAMLLRRKRSQVAPETPLTEDEKRALERALQ